MHILCLNTPLLLPLDKGGKLRTWHLMRHLARRHSITCVSFADPDAPRDHRTGMSEVCEELITIPRRESTKEGWRFHAAVARHLFDPVPYAVAQYRSTAYRRVVRNALARGTFDRVVCDFLVPAINLPAHVPVPSILFTHNVEAEIWRRHAETEQRAVRKWLYRVQWKRMLRFEGRTMARFDRVLAVSDVDRDTLQRLYPRELAAPVSVIPTGVDTTYFAPAAPAADAARRVVFTGSMDWLPNADGVLYFCREVLPLIRAVEPDVTFTIVGRSPTPEVRRLAEDRGVEVTGRVEDVRPYLAKSSVYVVPLRIGGGTRLKIFEAMAAGRAVVSTTIGAEGLPAEHGKHLLLADGAQPFANAVVALLRDADRRRAIEREARALVTERYDWAAAATQLEAAIADTRTAQHDAAASSIPLTPIDRVKSL
ncbi:MAG TPA: glycosyltransferase, partial [Vicinamibacterales bacterium]|nr:glycosyltransferase [Vicinamibacterales bacterium]